MKNAIIFMVLSIIPFLSPAISGHRPITRLPYNGGDVNPVVLDDKGEPVIAGAIYYAVPAPIGVTGGVIATNPNGNPNTCDVVLNMTVVGTTPAASEGRPIIFYPLEPDTSGNEEAVVRESLPLNVAFYSPCPSYPCAKERVWKLDTSDEPVVRTGGVIGDKSDISNWFRVEKNVNGRGYVFTYWPTLCYYCEINYWRTGLVGENYQLGINDDFAYPFHFVKAPYQTTYMWSDVVNCDNKQDQNKE